LCRRGVGAAPGPLRRRDRGHRPTGPGGCPVTTRPAGLLTQEDIGTDQALTCDVVVIGSGAGGATGAAALAPAGAAAGGLEEGGYHPTESFGTAMGRALRTLYRDGGGGSAIGTPPVLFSEGRCVGGSTVVNGGMSFRTPDRVLESWARDPALAGIGGGAMAP